MLEITKNMLDQTIEAERKNKAASDKSVQITAYIMLAAIGAEFVVLFMLLYNSFLTALIYVAIILAVDFVVFFGVTILMSKKYISGFTTEKFIHAFKRQKFNETVMSADNDTKIRLYEERFAADKGGEKILSANSLISLYLNNNDIDEWTKKAEELLKEIENIPPKNFLQRSLKALSYFTFYSVANDAEGYIKAFHENEKVIEEMWNETLPMKIHALKHTAIFLAYSGQYDKAVEYYLNIIEFQEKAGEIDASCGINEEGKKLVSIDLAELYCKIGNNEKAAEYFREAKEFFAETNIPFIKSELDRVGKTLAEAGIELSNVSETEE